MSELIAGRGATEIRVDGVDYTVNDPNIADEFATDKNYGTGECCYYQGTLHKFNQIHEAGEWNGAHADATKLAELIKEAEAQAGGAVSTAEEASLHADAAYQHADEAIQQAGTAMSLNLNSPSRIQPGSDLDNYTTPGNYHIQYFSDAAEIAHVPEKNPAKIAVMYTGNEAGLMQTYFSASGNIYIRTHDGLGWHMWQRFGYWNSIIETTKNQYTNEKIVKLINTQIIAGRISNTHADSRSYASMSAVTMYYDEVDAVFNIASTVVGRNSVVITPTRDITAIVLKHNGSTIDIGIKFGYTILANHSYMLSFDMVSADPTTVGGIVIENIQLEAGYTATDYIQGESAVDAVARSRILPGRWQGKTIVCFGDSRTWYDRKEYASATQPAWAGRICVGYQQTIAALTGAKMINQGANGDTSVQICSRIRAYNFSACDAVLLEGGVNDYIKSSQVTIGKLEPIGAVFNVNTVYGAWQSAVEYILTNYPRVKIFMDVPAIAWSATGSTFPYDVAKIKREVAELYNIPCCDLYKDGGLNVCNRGYYYVDDPSDGAYVHFNDYGNALVGAILAGYLNSEAGMNTGATQDAQRRDAAAVRGLSNQLSAVMKAASYDPAFANAPVPLSFINYTGNTQNVHPKVLYFPGKFGGHYYWMAYTPYPNGKDEFENPCIAYSEDGYTWTNYIGNPLDVPDGSYYNSDTHLVYRSDTGTMECWYRSVFTVTGGRTEKIYRQTTQDGVTWSSKELVYQTGTIGAAKLLSPAVIWDGTNYNIWVVDNGVITYYTAPGSSIGTWTKVRTYSLSFSDGGTAVNPWHLDVIKDGNTYIMIVMTMNGDAAGRNRIYSLFVTTSQDNESYGTPSRILGGSDNWDNCIYRSTIVKVGSVYRIYYSALNFDNVFGIGITESSTLGNFIGVYA